jgi:DNA-binding CsgD family transcriptional regulator
LERLSAREEQVLALAASGLLDKQIAVELKVTLNTLRTYWSRIRSKVGETSRSALAAAYVERRASLAPKVEDAAITWFVDMDRRVLCSTGSQDIFPEGEIDFDEAVARYHPDDAPRVEGTFRTAQESGISSFTFIARVVTDHGLELGSAYCEAVRDENGRTVSFVCRPVPIMNLASSPFGNMIGNYERDLRTGKVTVDDAYCAIYRVRKDDPNLFATALSRLCPDSRPGIATLADDVIASGRPMVYRSYRLCFEDGTQQWVSTRYRVEYEDNQPVRVTATVVAFE